MEDSAAQEAWLGSMIPGLESGVLQTPLWRYNLSKLKWGRDGKSCGLQRGGRKSWLWPIRLWAFPQQMGPPQLCSMVNTVEVGAACLLLISSYLEVSTRVLYRRGNWGSSESLSTELAGVLWCGKTAWKVSVGERAGYRYEYDRLPTTFYKDEV